MATITIQRLLPRLLQLPLQLLQAPRLAHADLGQLWAVRAVLKEAAETSEKNGGGFMGLQRNYPLVN